MKKFRLVFVTNEETGEYSKLAIQFQDSKKEWITECYYELDIIDEYTTSKNVLLGFADKVNQLRNLDYEMTYSLYITEDEEKNILKF